MTVLLKRPSCSWADEDGGAGRGGETPSSSAGSLGVLLRVVVLLGLAVGVILCHGCHPGDHDDELSILFVEDR